MTATRKFKSNSTAIPAWIEGFPAWGAIQEALRRPVLRYDASRRIQAEVWWKPEELPWLTLDQLKQYGYKKPGIKMKALQRMYFNAEEVERVKALLEKRKDQDLTIATLSTIAGAKDKRSMGHCINNITFIIQEERTHAIIMYRSTELTKKFSADLAFLPWVIEQVGIEVQSVSFVFACCYFSAVFMPIFLNFLGPLKALDWIRSYHEKQLFLTMGRFIRRAVRGPEEIFPYSPEQNQHEYAWEKFPDLMPQIRRYLEHHLPAQRNRVTVGDRDPEQDYQEQEDAE